ncbi:hypothetical protein GF336_04905 [Candidatus Woesearchaeota archaeon]|nr:hypothetical protein [Candidatus Woesearchaeota archaeon]
MVEQSTFRGVLEFLGKIGVYDVILPFLLVFTIVFAILERTKILGTEKIGDNTYTKKNLNSMVAFVISFLVIASTKLVATINRALADATLLLLLFVMFLLLVGVFFKEGEVFVSERWRAFFMVIAFVGLVLIFLNALDWLSPFWDFLKNNWETQWVGSAILLLFAAAFIWYITREQKAPAKKEE